jgi:hypothetical protein
MEVAERRRLDELDRRVVGLWIDDPKGHGQLLALVVWSSTVG